MKKETYMDKCIKYADYLIGKKAITFVEWNIIRYGKLYLKNIDFERIKDLYRSLKERVRESEEYYGKKYEE